MRQEVALFWFRRDLRLDDNAGFYHALKSVIPVLPIFIFDRLILDDLEDKQDRRVSFIYDQLQQMQQELVAHGSSLRVIYGTPDEAFKMLTDSFSVKAVYTNHDYEPYALRRDEAIGAFLQSQSIPFYTYKDQVVFEKDEVLKDDGKPYTVYTPYSKKWKALVNDFYLKPYPTKKYFSNLLQHEATPIPTLASMGFQYTSYEVPAPVLDEKIARRYHETRNTPGLAGTTRLSVHLRFGTISIRKLAAESRLLNEKLLNELIWREFFMMILWHFPHTVNQAFKPVYDQIAWRRSEADFERWCAGKTGYPIVDAGMRELNATGFMHNRTRMVTASFLCKHLLIDWRWGEAYFAKKLIDFDLAQNVASWQWVAGSGVDAAPYFRIFNPHTQTEKFDPDHRYINKWVPDRQELTYRPIVDHEVARKRCLAAYSIVKEAKDKIDNTNFEEA